VTLLDGSTLPVDVPKSATGKAYYSHQSEIFT
jgi:hypothetical protein